MRIACPWCGERDSREFSYLGDARPVRPGAASASPEAMLDYVYLRDNPAGMHEELWYHGAGCQTWLRVRRDTRNHSIEAVSAAGPSRGREKP